MLCGDGRPSPEDNHRELSIQNDELARQLCEMGRVLQKVIMEYKVKPEFAGLNGAMKHYMAHRYQEKSFRY